MDLTVAAVPFYFGSMEAERRWLRRHHDDPRFEAGQYERSDTIANLTMGTASLVAPLGAMALRRRLELGRGRWAKPALGLAAAAAVVTTAADQVLRRLGPDDTGPATAPAPAPGSRHERRRARARAVATHAAQVGSVTAVVAGGLVVTSTWGAKLATNRLWPHRRFELPGWKGVAAAIVGWDFIYYWNHRFMHESRFMWAIHVVHHSSERYNLSVALRQPVADALGVFVPYGLLCLLGISPAAVETARGVNLIYQYWIHTEAIPKLGAFEVPFNTASHHRVHHGTNARYIDRNHGSILILWDRWFGTFEPEDERVTYGLTTNLDSFSAPVIMGHEHVEMLRDVAGSTSWRERLSFLLRGPGWAYEQHRARRERPVAAAAPT